MYIITGNFSPSFVPFLRFILLHSYFIRYVFYIIFYMFASLHDMYINPHTKPKHRNEEEKELNVCVINSLGWEISTTCCCL